MRAGPESYSTDAVYKGSSQLESIPLESPWTSSPTRPTPSDPSSGPTKTTTIDTTTAPSTSSTNSTTPAPNVSPLGLPYPVFIVVFVWLSLILLYLILKWRQKNKSNYIIPRVFVLCSPRTVQFHYELILRIGLPSSDFVPEKHDIDITVLGRQKNEIVPMTRLNTNTLLDEPLITNLSIIVYRLVEMPMLGGLILRHSGPFKSWVYVYDFTIIDLSTNREYYFPVNQYIGSLDKMITLREPNEATSSVYYPIDDVPLPSWLLEDIFLLLYTIVTNIMFFLTTIMPINCSNLYNIVSITITSINTSFLCLFLTWLLYYFIQWNQDRKEYFNQNRTLLHSWLSNNYIRVIVFTLTSLMGCILIYYSVYLTDLKSSIVWLLAVINCFIIVVGGWNVARLVGIGDSIVALGLRLQGIEMVPIGMTYSELARTKSGSGTSDEGGIGSNVSNASNISRVGIRSSVKSFGFNPSIAIANRDRLKSMPNPQLVSSLSNQTNFPRMSKEDHKSTSSSRKRRKSQGKNASSSISTLSSSPVRNQSNAIPSSSSTVASTIDKSEITEVRSKDKK